MVLEFRTNLLNVEILHPIHKYNGMGIAHGDTGHAVFPAIDRDRSIYHSRSVCGLLRSLSLHRHLRRSQDRLSHIYTYLCHLSSVRGGFPFHCQVQIFYLAGTDDGNIVLVRQSFIINIFCHTTDPVAAHLRTGTVGIIHLHLKISFFCGVDKNHTVSADPEMPVTELSHDLRFLLWRKFFRKAVDIYIIIATALHLCKFHGLLFLLLFSFTYPVCNARIPVIISGPSCLLRHHGQHHLSRLHQIRSTVHTGLLKISVGFFFRHMISRHQ